MTPAEYAKLKELFFAALERPVAERADFLDVACGSDLDARLRILALLEHAREGDGFLEAPPELPAEAEEELVAGARLGPWEILHEVGRGGMGTVYEARRAEGDFQRRTAIKVVRPEIATPFFLRRFKTERRILAGLDHPNIARLFDAGATSDGRPYVVLEFVEGQPLLEYCAAGDVDIKDRLKLFLSICAAVDHAHRNLVVHRDLKPGNILVTTDGVPKLLDFGIAKLLEPESGAGLEVTGTLLHLTTPDYASPEQVAGGRITTATDVYSLGVVLYELLTGRRPFRFETSEPREIARVVAEEAPPKPSVRVARVGQDSSSGVPPGPPNKLARRLRGDLDTIVMMAMRKEPERRYGSVQQLSEDVARHLEGLPVLARKDTLGYRSSKFVRRHRAGVAAAALAVAALATGFVLTVHEKTVADAQRLRADRRFNDVRKLAGSFLFEFHDAIENLPGATPARALVVKRALEYLDSLSSESAGDAGLRRELAAAYQKIGEVQGGPASANLGDTRGALKSFRKALETRRALAAQSPANPEFAGELAATLDSLGDTLSQTGDKRGAFNAFRRSLEVRERMVSSDPKGVTARRALATSYHRIASILADQGDYRQALPVWRKELVLFEALWIENPTDRRAQRNVALAYKYTGGTLEALGDTTRALDLYKKAIALDEARSAADPTDAAARIDLSYSYGAMSICLSKSDDFDGALFVYRKAFAIRQTLSNADPKNVKARAAVARAYLRIGEIFQLKADSRAAAENYRKALEIEETLSKSDPFNEAARERVAVVLDHEAAVETSLAAAPATSSESRAGHWREGRSLYLRSLDIWQDLSRRGVLRGGSAGEPGRVAHQIALCEEALKRR